MGAGTLLRTGPADPPPFCRQGFREALPACCQPAAGHTAAVPYTYEYPRPAVTVDTVLCTLGPREQLCVLLIQRGRDPFAGSWALPGGFVDAHEDLPTAARRELEEEASVRVRRLLQLGAYGKPGRDPRGHTVGVAFLALAAPGTVEAVAGDDAAAVRWFPLRRPPKLAFDHADMLRDARARLAALAADHSAFARTFASGKAPSWLERLRRAAR